MGQHLLIVLQVKIHHQITKRKKSSTSSSSEEEEALRQSFTNLVQLQHDLQEDVRFTRASASSLSVKSGNDGDDTLWSTVRLWQSYTEQRLVARQNELQKEFQEKLLKF